MHLSLRIQLYHKLTTQQSLCVHLLLPGPSPIPIQRLMPPMPLGLQLRLTRLLQMLSNPQPLTQALLLQVQVAVRRVQTPVYLRLALLLS